MLVHVSGCSSAAIAATTRRARAVGSIPYLRSWRWFAPEERHLTQHCLEMMAYARVLSFVETMPHALISCGVLHENRPFHGRVTLLRGQHTRMPCAMASLLQHERERYGGVWRATRYI